MTDKEEWGPWIDHDGKRCPCVGMLVEAVFLISVYRGDPRSENVKDTRVGPPEVFIAGSEGGASWIWANWPGVSRVIRYRIRKPRALMDLIELVENLPTPVGPQVAA